MAETFRSRIYKRLPAQLKMVLLKIKSNESYFSFLGFFNLFFFVLCVSFWWKKPRASMALYDVSHCWQLWVLHNSTSERWQTVNRVYKHADSYFWFIPDFFDYSNLADFATFSHQVLVFHRLQGVNISLIHLSFSCIDLRNDENTIDDVSWIAKKTRDGSQQTSKDLCYLSISQC